MKNVLITGGAGFIGCNLTEKILDKCEKVVCVDNFTLGSKAKIEKFLGNPRYAFYEADVADSEKLQSIIRDNEIDMIYHLAANSDIQKGGKEPKIDLHNTFETTFSVLDAMRKTGVKDLFFASTSAIYGEKLGVDIKESDGGLQPISYYGSGKLASEAFISSFSYMNDFNTVIFRFANVIGPGLTHGVIFDFVRKLKDNPR